MSHELRTPLNSVIGFSDALLRERGAPDAGRVAEFAQEINGAGRRLLSLINNILDVARIEAGRFDLAADRIDLLRLVQTCMRQADPAARAAEITLEIDIPTELPVLQSDERRLQQALNHLISNAVKFTDAGGVVTVSGAVDQTGDLLVRVSDTGIGIAESDLDRVFEPFIQLDGGLSRRFQGAGLGLYVSRALVEAQGGQLRLSSQPGLGTTAEIRLPSERLLRPATIASYSPQERP
jgi:signal transduction histidine kinase